MRPQPFQVISEFDGFEVSEYKKKSGRLELKIQRNSAYPHIWGFVVCTSGRRYAMLQSEGNLTIEEAFANGELALKKYLKVKKIVCPDCEGKGHI